MISFWFLKISPSVKHQATSKSGEVSRLVQDVNKEEEENLSLSPVREGQKEMSRSTTYSLFLVN